VQESQKEEKILIREARPFIQVLLHFNGENINLSSALWPNIMDMFNAGT
jgi:hypothetical protein